MNDGNVQVKQEKDGEDLRADCDHCFGLCCVSLCFSASEGFPIDKEAGQPCIQLQHDFRCNIHKSLSARGLKGCLAFDCFGAGQKVSQITFRGQDWRQFPDTAKSMFNAFLVMLQLHELMWYLTEAMTLQAGKPVHDEIRSLLEMTERWSLLPANELLELDMIEHRAHVNTLLIKTSELVRTEAQSKQTHGTRPKKGGSARKVKMGRGADLIAADLRKVDLKGAYLRGAYLIAADLRGANLRGADLIGADFRDADIRGADLSKSIFLTQSQINAAKGDDHTRLPLALTRPQHWDDPFVDGALYFNQKITCIMDLLDRDHIHSRVEDQYQTLLKEDIIKIVQSIILLALPFKAPDEWSFIIKVLRQLNGYNSRTSNTVQQTLEGNFVKYIKTLELKMTNLTTVDELYLTVLDILNHLDREKLRGVYRQYNNAYLDTLIKNYVSLLWAEYETCTDWVYSIERFKGMHSIPVMSIHKSKGLEYKVVFLIGLEDDAFFGDNIDEELCTFFVAISRAIEQLFITKCDKRGDDVKTVDKVKPFFNLWNSSGIGQLISFKNEFNKKKYFEE
ncbi:pentapeptide repeat-containing protein [Paenibacillus sp. JSM ZJ436]|uniref:pentapeptide repeat-containing protein n=1 Tax=Paenibacillus sp. JSM ZJ436 TaxID=3376190 RepID=UPI0037C6898E